MADLHPEISADLADWIGRQKIFFAATAAPEGLVNVSPRSTKQFRVTGAHEVCWLSMLGSGNETAAHLRLSPRATVMFCAFEGPPRILRLYGEAENLYAGSAGYAAALAAHFDGEAPRSARQIIRLRVERVQTSCGYGVPLFDYKDDRPNLQRWADAKSDDELTTYLRERNAVSFDGFDTGLPAET
ncbi:MAG: pyridoxamine 5'-phosphate oxidase family protein [Pseudomonadota bacterium]